MEGSHVAATHKNKIVCPHDKRAAAPARLRPRGLLDRRGVGSQQLFHVGINGARQETPNTLPSGETYSVITAPLEEVIW